MHACSRSGKGRFPSVSIEKDCLIAFCMCLFFIIWLPNNRTSSPRGYIFQKKRGTASPFRGHAVPLCIKINLCFLRCFLHRAPYNVHAVPEGCDRDRSAVVHQHIPGNGDLRVPGIVCPHPCQIRTLPPDTGSEGRVSAGVRQT